MGEQGGPAADICRQFVEWLTHRVDHGPLVFVVSFTEKGNLLSQWRGYTPHGQGVSLGFTTEHITTAAAAASFQLGRCIYDLETQDRRVADLLGHIVAGATAAGPSPAVHVSQNYHPYFTQIEGQILRICALFKNPSFDEEVEWRAVSA